MRVTSFAAVLRAGSLLRASDSQGKRVSLCFPRQRAGAATLEFAAVGSIMFLMVLAAIQFASLMMSQNVLTAAAREGGRVASMSSTLTTATVEDAVEDRLRRGGVDPSVVTVTVEPAVMAALQTGDEITVSVSGAMSDLSWIGAVALPQADLTAEITYIRE